MENKKKKRCGIIAALLLLVLAAGVGTYAWLTAQEHIDNVFTVVALATRKTARSDRSRETGPDNSEH